MTEDGAGAVTSDLSPQEIWQSSHRADHKAIQAYQSAHPDVVSTMWTDRGPPIRFRVLLWGPNQESSALELRATLEHPNDVNFDAAQHAPAELREVLEVVRSRLSAEGPGSSMSVGLGIDAVNVTLAAHREDLAVSLHEQFGDAVVLKVGQFPYPADRPLTHMERLLEQRRGDAPQVPPREPTTISGLECQIKLATSRIAAGSRFDAWVVLTNASAQPIQLELGAARVDILDVVSGAVLGGFQGAVVGVAYTLTVAPGETRELHALTGTGSYRLDLGYTLPSGRYLARADLELVPRERPGGPTFLRTRAVPIVLVDEAPLS